MIPRFLNIALGVWLMVAPAVLGYADATVAAGNDRIVGPLVVSAAIVAIWPFLRALRWVNVVLGGWMVLAPLVLRLFAEHPLAATVSSIATGIAIVATALVEGDRGEDTFGGGWRSIWRDDVDTVTGSGGRSGR